MDGEEGLGQPHVAHAEEIHDIWIELTLDIEQSHFLGFQSCMPSHKS